MSTALLFASAKATCLEAHRLRLALHESISWSEKWRSELRIRRSGGITETQMACILESLNKNFTAAIWAPGEPEPVISAAYPTKQ